MGSYSARRGTRTGAVLWRVVSDSTDQRVDPDGVLDLMWSRERLVVAGPDTQSMVARTGPGDVTWGLRLAPGVGHALLGVPAHELTDQRVALSDLVTLPQRGRPFGEDVPGALEGVFLALWARADPERPVLRMAASLDRAARAGVSVRAMAESHDLPVRSLHRLSNRLFGYGPRTLTRIHRFQRALRLARGGTPLSAAAATAGYADQAHFTRESRQLTGRTPGELRRTA